MNELVDRVRRHSTAISVALLALLAYLPSLTAAPGRMPTDSKLYVYLDPGRFVADTTTTFDARQFAGWVPHQHIAYLWPTGPWYWVFEQLGVPDWIAHRLWIGTLLFAAGLGGRWMARTLGFAPLAALAAAFVYQLSPYVLPYISRTSVLLLPFAGLGWIVGCTILATRRGRWRYPAGIALIVLTVGAVNATALAMIIPAPFLWLVHAAWQRSITWRRAGLVALKVSVLSTGVSLWWMAMLVIQGRFGADVLAYSESLESVSFTSTSTEVARGLGYWLFYIRDAFAATTTASIDHLVSIRVILAGFVLLVVCLVGVVGVRSPHRRFAGLLVATGVILGVGVHPIDDPSPLMDVLVGDGQGGLALALRSSTRAVPVLLLGLAIGAASLVTVSGDVAARVRNVRPAAGRVAVFGVVAVLAVVNLPALRTGGFVDPALERDQDPPGYWLDAAAALDDRAEGYRVLQVPGTEFGAFAWGYTVDQPLPGLTERPLVTRDLLPLGSPAAMDLAFALDDRLQEGTAEVAAFAPIARLLGVDTIWVSGDVSFERFGLARPEVVTDLLTSADARATDLSTTTAYGPPAPVTPAIPVLDAETLGDPVVGEPIAPITLVDVDDPVPTVRVKDETVLLVGSGDGLVDAAAAGVLDGTDAVIYAASDADVPGGVDRVVLTDSNRRRAHQWRSSQDVHGYTEAAGDDGEGSGVLRFEPADQRLPVFGEEPADPDSQTVSIQRGPVTARASAYGEPFAYRPEHRAVMAIDGDRSTSWLVADRAPAIGEFIELTIDGPIDHLDLRQPDTPTGARSIDEVEVTIDGGPPRRFALGPESFVDAGQRVPVVTAGPSTVRITIVATDDPQPPIADAIGAVGFAEIGTGDEPTVEWIRPPLFGDDQRAASTPTDIVLTRLRTEATDRWRDDPEPVLRREIDLPTPVTGTLDVTVRFDQRAGGPLLADVLEEPVVDNRHLTGVPAARGAAAFDADPSSSWITPFVDPVGSAVTYSGSGTASTLTVEQPDGTFSPITTLRLDDGAGSFDVAMSPGDVTLPRPIDLADLTIEIVSIDPQVTIDRRYAEPFVLPAAISEIRFDGVSPAVTPRSTFEASCRDDLVVVDGAAVPVSFTADLDDILSGAAITAVPCDPTVELDSGIHRIEGRSGSGYDVDRVVVSSPAEVPAVAGVDVTDPVLVDSTRRSRTIEVPPCPEGCWVIVGEGFNEAWSASSDGVDLGAPTLVDGNANGWWLEPSDTSRVVVAEWTAQGPLDLAFLLTALSVLLAVALVVWDRRRESDAAIEPVGARAHWAPSVGPGRGVLVAAGVTVLSAGLFIGWPWMVIASVSWAAAIALRRPHLVGWVGLLLVAAVGVVVTFVVRRDRPFPNAGWPVRFEWLHGWTLLGIVLIAGSTLLTDVVATCEAAEDDDR